MTSVQGQCQHCGKNMPRHRGETEFCSEACAHEYLDQIKANRHGGGALVPKSRPQPSKALPKPVAVALARPAARAIQKDSPALSKIRTRVDAAAESRRLAELATSIFEHEPSVVKAPVAKLKPKGVPVSLPPPAELGQTELERLRTNPPDSAPARLTDQFPLSEPHAILVNLAPRGSFERFPIGDLALVAPAELPVLPESGASARPPRMNTLRALRGLDPQQADTIAHRGGEFLIADRSGRPVQLRIGKPAAITQDSDNTLSQFLSKLDPSLSKTSAPLDELRIQPPQLSPGDPLRLSRPELSQAGEGGMRWNARDEGLVNASRI